MNITFDLDGVIFDIEQLYKEAFRIHNIPYKPISDWNLYKSCPKEVADSMMKLFTSHKLYDTHLIDARTSTYINEMLGKDKYRISFVTERLVKNQILDYKQLITSGIQARMGQVYDEDLPKVEVLKMLGSNLHFDDSPKVVEGCLDSKIPIVMISNKSTEFNHYLRDKVEHYASLNEALLGRRLVKSR